MIAKFIEFLQKVDLELGVKDVLEIEDVLDILWLALQLNSSGYEKIGRSHRVDGAERVRNTSQIPSEQDSNKPVESSQSSASSLSQQPSVIEEPMSTGLYFPSQQGKNLARGGLPFESPTVNALPEALDLVRALRPLMRRIPSRIHKTIDEDMTAQRTAERLSAQQTTWFPVLQPTPTRWLELALVIDESRSMDIWRLRIVALKHLLEQLGAFRDVRTWGLVAHTDKDTLHIRTWLKAESQLRNPRELIESGGQRLILVVSDCVAEMWHDSRVINVLESWGRVGPVAIVQVLPAWLWSKSALGYHTAVQLQASLPGLPNTQLDYEAANPFIEKADLKGRLPMPIITLEKEAHAKWVAEWVKGVLTAENEQTPGYMLITSAEQKEAYKAAIQNKKADILLTPEQLLQHFSESASPKARALLGLLAAAPIINFPMMRLLQETTLTFKLSHVAEVFLSGLIKQLSGDSKNPDAISYDFVGGVRDLILDSQPRSTSVKVLRIAISHFVEQRIGQSLTLPVLLEDPRPTAKSLIQGASQPFAQVTAKVLQRVGGEYASLARYLENMMDTSREYTAKTSSDDQRMTPELNKDLQFTQFESVTFILSEIEESFIAALAGKLTDEVWVKFQSNPVNIAFKQAVGAAIQRYATSHLSLNLARPLLEKDGFLTLPTVADEVTQLVRFEREPNAELIGQQWKASMDDPPSWFDFTFESRRFLEYLQVELRSTEVFRPAFDAQRLDAIAVSTADSTASFARTEVQLADLAQLMDTSFSQLTRTFMGAPINLREQIRDYTRFINEKTHDFMGRQFIFDAVTRFTETQPRGYFFIRGDPGIGKSALAAQMVRTHGYVHHFNIQSEGINRTDTFLRNVCAQLIVAYQLDHTFLPPEATQDAGFLNRLLEEISAKLGPQEKAIIVVDALDEVDTLGLSPGVNVLYLPVTLPYGIYVIVTTRRVPNDLRIDCERNTLDIEYDSAGNIADIREYIKQAVRRPGIQAYITAQSIDNELFIEHMMGKSEGSFIYLYYVLPEIEHGYYADLGLETLPAGLQNYYESHWRRMRGNDENAWFTYKLPIIMALTVVKEPVSIDLIADFSRVQERAGIREVLDEWAPFLHEEHVLYEGDLQKRYHMYHASFHDFIAKKEEIENERVSRKGAHKKIADVLWSELIEENTTNANEPLGILQSSVNITPVERINVQITIFSNKNEYSAYIIAEQANPQYFSIALTSGDIESINMEFRKIFQIVSRDREKTNIHTYAQQLARVGKFAFNRIFSEPARKMINEILRADISLHIVSDKFFIPWELLYDGPLDDINELYFWGMRHVISRAIISEIRPNKFVSPVLQSVSMNIGLVANNELVHVTGQELPFLKDLALRREISLSTLIDLKPAQRSAALDEFGRFLEQDFQILHLACHAYENSAQSSPAIIISDNFVIEIEDFVVHEFELKSSPLVILNASMDNPLNAVKWASLFLRIGARGILLPNFSISDEFAASFIKNFYEVLFSGRPLGESILATRRYYWEQHLNLGGLAYVSYAPPMLKLSNGEVAQSEKQA